MAEMIQLLTRYYSVSEETARELITELSDLKSLQSLAGNYRVARAVVQAETHRPSKVSRGERASKPRPLVGS